MAPLCFQFVKNRPARQFLCLRFGRLYELTADPESLFALSASAENGRIERLSGLFHWLGWVIVSLGRYSSHQDSFQRTASGTKIHLLRGTGRRGYR